MIPTRAAAACCAFLFFIGGALAEKKTFNVVSFGHVVQVQVNGNNPVTMRRAYSKQPLFTADVDVDGSVHRYRYIEDGEEEDFERKFPTGALATFNDFFGRKDTIRHLRKLALPFKGKKNGQWTRGMGQVKPFNETYIPTVHFTGKNVMKFFKKPKKIPAKTKYSAFIVLQDEAKLFTDVELESTNRRFPKFAIKMSLAPKDEFYGRNVYKFRFGEFDPTFMREKLYTDLLVAVGAPVHQTGLVRVYADGNPIGLYILQDETADEKFIQSEFYANGDVPSRMGYPLDAGTGADFLWTDEPRHPKDPWDSFDPRVGIEHVSRRNYNPHATNDRVVELSRALHKLDPNDEKAVDEFDKNWFDIDTFFKAMALEYALGHWDSYWGLTSNFVVYDDPKESNPPNSYKFYFLDQDLEFTFGSCLPGYFNEYGRDFTKQSYKTLLNRTWKSEPKDAERRTMLDKLISGPALTERFESILIAIVKHVLNPNGMFGRIDDLADRYREELKWDRSLQRLRVGKVNNNWTLEDLDFGINGYPEGADTRGIEWGLKPYIQERADAVAKDFNFEYKKADVVSGTEKGHIEDKDVKEPQNQKVGDSNFAVEKSTTSVMTTLLIATSFMMVLASVIG